MELSLLELRLPHARALKKKEFISESSLVPGASADEPAELELDDDPEESSRLDVSGVPLIITLTKVGTHSVVDATEEVGSTGYCLLWS